MECLEEILLWRIKLKLSPRNLNELWLFTQLDKENILFNFCPLILKPKAKMIESKREYIPLSNHGYLNVQIVFHKKKNLQRNSSAFIVLL